MAYDIKNFDSLLGTEGFSDQLLNNHFQLYAGYVKNTNACHDIIHAKIKEGDTGPTFAEVVRRFDHDVAGNAPLLQTAIQQIVDVGTHHISDSSEDTHRLS